MICDACKAQIGLRAAWRAHSSLKTCTVALAPGYSVTAFQMLYRCTGCGTMLVKGKNTGWAEAIPSASDKIAAATPV